METPYGLIVDVKMLYFFTRMSLATAIVLAVLALASFFIRNAWCRYLCPYGALMGLVALASPARIRRCPDACIDCGKCARACPAEGALEMSFFRRRRLPAWVFAAGIVALAKLAGTWDSDIPRETYSELIPKEGEFRHP
jgi:ferredoxin